MKIQDLIADIDKQNQLRKDVLDTLKKHSQDPENSARLAYALIELGITAFQNAGMCSHLVMMLCNMIAHGATTERALASLKLIQEEDELKDEIDPERKVRREEARAKAPDTKGKYEVH